MASCCRQKHPTFEPNLSLHVHTGSSAIPTAPIHTRVLRVTREFNYWQATCRSRRTAASPCMPRAAPPCPPTPTTSPRDTCASAVADDPASTCMVACGEIAWCQGWCLLRVQGNAHNIERALQALAVRTHAHASVILSDAIPMTGQSGSQVTSAHKPKAVALTLLAVPVRPLTKLLATK